VFSFYCCPGHPVATSSSDSLPRRLSGSANLQNQRGDATISLQTKKIHRLHENGFILATKIDRISLAQQQRESSAT
jgi:hypothetical protein